MELAMNGRWPVWQLMLLLYVFVAAAVAINLFLLGLLLTVTGAPALAPNHALALSIPLGVPASWLAAKWVRSLLDEAEAPATERPAQPSI